FVSSRPHLGGRNMMFVSSRTHFSGSASPQAQRTLGAVGRAPQLLIAAALSTVISAQAPAAEPVETDPAMAARIQTLIADLEAYMESGMKAFGTTGLAFGIVTGDRLVYARGFGVRSKAGGVPVDARTIFQIGSTTKAFLAATMGIWSIAASSAGMIASSI